jgi:HK97 family phage major capsid protein
MKDFLNKTASAKEKRAAELRELIKKAATADEVRSLGDTLQTVLDELNDAKKQLDDLDKDNNKGGEGQNNGQNDQPADEGRSANPFKEFREKGSYSQQPKQPEQDDDKTNSNEYRSAFMAYVMRGTPIPAQVRENTLTTDAVSVIPTVVINKIIERMDEVGHVLNLVTRTSYAAGVEIPTSATKPVATWVNEGAGSNRQKKPTGKITFTYFKLRCEVSVSMEVHTMALSAFEAKLAENVANAMVKAIEAAIINGTGVGQPKGILTETPNAGQAITPSADTAPYEMLCECEGALPAEHENGAKWCMNKKTFMTFIGAVDSNGQPIARVNYGVSGKPERVLLGREVVVTEHVPAGKAFIYDFADYILNTIYDLGIQKKQDWDTEDMLTKAVMSVDGKSTNNDSLVIVTLA